MEANAKDAVKEPTYWRQLIRVVRVSKVAKEMRVVIPGWDARLVVGIPFEIIPAEVLSTLKVGSRFHAKVTIGAENKSGLFYKDFEKE